MNKFYIGDKVIVNDKLDLYFGYFAKVTGIQMYTLNEVPKYEVQFIENDQYFPNDCRTGIYPE